MWASRDVAESKVAKVANFWGSGFGDLAGQKLTTRMTHPGPDWASMGWVLRTLGAEIVLLALKNEYSHSTA